MKCVPLTQAFKCKFTFKCKSSYIQYLFRNMIKMIKMIILFLKCYITYFFIIRQ